MSVSKRKRISHNQEEKKQRKHDNLLHQQDRSRCYATNVLFLRPLKVLPNTSNAVLSYNPACPLGMKTTELCRRFLHLYGSDENAFSINDAAGVLQVSRPRLNGILNILKCLDIVSEDDPDTFRWKGMKQLLHIFGCLQAEAISLWPRKAMSNGLEVRLQNHHQTESYLLPQTGMEWCLSLLLKRFLIGECETGHTASKVSFDKSNNESSCNDDDSETMAEESQDTHLNEVAKVLVSLNILKINPRGDKKVYQWSYHLSAREIQKSWMNHMRTTGLLIPSTQVQAVQEKSMQIMNKAANTQVIKNLDLYTQTSEDQNRLLLEHSFPRHQTVGSGPQVNRTLKPTWQMTLESKAIPETYGTQIINEVAHPELPEIKQACKLTDVISAVVKFQKELKDEIATLKGDITEIKNILRSFRSI